MDTDDAQDVNTRKFLSAENIKLRERCLILGQRQDVLEEFVEFEVSNEEGVHRFKTNRERLIYALEIPKEEVTAAMWEGKRSPKYRQMLRLIRQANDYWGFKRTTTHRPSNRDARLRFENSVPPDLADLRLHINFDTGLICRKPTKRCNTCHDESHEQKMCPYKLVENRTPEVTAMIQERFNQMKEVEGKDPLISNAYKLKKFKIISKSSICGQRELKRQEKIEMFKQRRAERKAAEEARQKDQTAASVNAV